MQNVANTWQQYGLDVDFAALTFDGDRHDVPEFLDDCGWDTDAVPMSTLLANKGYPPFPGADGEATSAEVRCTTSRKRGQRVSR